MEQIIIEGPVHFHFWDNNAGRTYALKLLRIYFKPYYIHYLFRAAIACSSSVQIKLVCTHEITMASKWSDCDVRTWKLSEYSTFNVFSMTVVKKVLRRNSELVLNLFRACSVQTELVTKSFFPLIYSTHTFSNSSHV